ncbi:hypothetical protein AmDm5_1762 [Acetobacter malorum]|nr:hypothetical protein AmDm5_1762 [Acetobacter malorum]
MTNEPTYMQANSSIRDYVRSTCGGRYTVCRGWLPGMVTF